MGKSTLEEIGKNGDHLCCIYEGEQDRWPAIAAFVAQGLALNEKVLYVADDRPAENTLKYIRDEGVAVDGYYKSGQLSILSAQEAYLREETFNPSRMFALLENATNGALNEGFSGLRGTGEMSWALKSTSGFERLIEYEAKLNEFLSGKKYKALCQYDRNRFDAAILLDVLSTHPVVVLGNEVYNNDFYFLPAHDFLSEKVKDAKLESCLKNLAEKKRAEKDLRESEKRYRDLVDNANSIILHWDAKGEIVFMNPYGLDFFGYTMDELAGRNVVGTIVPAKESTTKRDLSLLMKDIQKNPDEYKDNENENMRKDGSRVWVVWTNKAISVAGGNTVEILSVGNEITHRKKAQLEIERHSKELRTLNRQLRKELKKSKKLEKVLAIKSQSLEETNTALKVLLDRREKDKNTLADTVLDNMKVLVHPFLGKLKQSNLQSTQKAYLEVVEKNLEHIISPFSQRLSAQYAGLTPTEIRVANLVKEGRSTKEIAELLGASKRTIDFHRKSIRKKLGITHEKVSLQAYLLSLLA